MTCYEAAEKALSRKAEAETNAPLKCTKKDNVTQVACESCKSNLECAGINNTWWDTLTKMAAMMKNQAIINVDGDGFQL